MNERNWRRSAAAFLREHPRGVELFAAPRLPAAETTAFSPVGDHVLTHEAPDAAALIWLLAPQLKARVPELVDALLPDGAAGLKAADRAAQLASVEARLATLFAERDRLQAEVREALAQLEGPGHE